MNQIKPYPIFQTTILENLKIEFFLVITCQGVRGRPKMLSCPELS
jgi:hypothetical protein